MYRSLLVLLLLAGVCEACHVEPSCGDGRITPDEACDDGAASSTCDTDCTAVACGDGTVNELAGEACEPRDNPLPVGYCRADCTLVPPPTATAGGDREVWSTYVTQLDGSASLGESLTFAWRQTAGPSVTLSDANTATPWLLAPPSMSAILSFELVVTDLYGQSSAPDEVLVRVEDSGPVAHAGGDLIVTRHQSVCLDASESSTPLGGDLTWEWTQLAGSEVVFDDSRATKPCFLSPGIQTTLRFSLIATDSRGQSSPTDEVTVTVHNNPPVAHSVSEQYVARGEAVALDGNGSYDPDPADTITYAWTQVGELAVDLDDATTSTPTFTAPNTPVVLEFRLVVNDGVLSSSVATVNVYVGIGPPIAAEGGEIVWLEGPALDGGWPTYRWVQTEGAHVILGGAESRHAYFRIPKTGGTFWFDLAIEEDGVTEHHKAWVRAAPWFGASVPVRSSPLNFFVERPRGNETQVVGTHAYVAFDHGFQIFDVSDPASPRRLSDGGISSFGLTLGPNNILYGVQGVLEMKAVDVSIPGSPQEIGSIDLPGVAVDVVTDEHFAYVATDQDGVRIVSIDDPANLFEVAHCESGSLRTVALAPGGDVLFAGDVAAGVRAIDISDPTSPVCHDAEQSSPALWAMQVHGNTLYVISGLQLWAVDATDPYNLVWTSSVPLWAPGDFPDGMAIANERLYVAWGFDGVVVIDISEPLAPELLGHFSATSAVTSVGALAAGPVDYVFAGTRRGLEIIKIGDVSPAVGDASLGFAATTLAVAESVVYANDDEDFVLLDARAPTAPSVLSSTPNSMRSTELIRVGHHLLAARANTSVLMDISSPRLPVDRATLSTPDLTRAALDHERVYWTTSDNHTHTLDFTGPSVVIGETLSLTDAARTVDLCIANDRLLVSTYEGYHTMLYTFGPAMGAYTQSIIGYSGAVSCSQRAYIASTYFGTTTFELAELNQPTGARCQIPTFGNGIRVREFGPYLLFLGGGGGVTILESQVGSDCESYNVVGHVDTPGEAVDATIVGDALYVADTSGLELFRLRPVILEQKHVVTAGDTLTYDVAWSEPADRLMDIVCQVTDGTCSVDDVDQLANTAKVQWTLPQGERHAQLAVTVGSPHGYWVATDNITVR